MAEHSVDITSVLYDTMAEKWDMIHALLGGTQTMRDARTTYLPIEPAEEVDKYNLRLARSFLFGSYASSVSRIVAKPFSRPVTVTPTFTGKLDRFDEDVDGEGTNLTQFAKQFFEHGVNYGLSHFLIDFPTMPANSTLADEIGVRPVWIHVAPPQLIFWRTEVRNGAIVLTEIRFRETSVTPKNDYGDERVETIRVYRQNDWEIWEKSGSGWVSKLSGVNSLGFIPLVTVYLNKAAFLTASPPLEDLAWLNVRHWQSDSDQTNILRFARCGILHAKGFSEKEAEGINIGPNELIQSVNENSSLVWVEHTGKAIAAGAANIDALEARMELLGQQPFIARSSASTATSKLIDESKIETEVQSWIRALEIALAQGIVITEEWMKIEETQAVVDIFNDFTLSVKATTDVEQLLKTRLAGQITHELFLTEIKRRGLISDSIVIVDQVQAAQEEQNAELRESGIT